MRLYINDNLVILKFINKLTILEATYELGIYLPFFCSNNFLMIAGNCRMCLVEVIKLSKPMIACLNLCFENLKLYTNSFKLQKLRENVLEFLLVNHPLDCPICDQAGECDLQEQSLHYGVDNARFFFNKRSVVDQFLTPTIKLILNRCILCLRCIRFLIEYSNNQTLGVIGRGIYMKIATYINRNLDFKFAANIIDLCPVGSFGRIFSTIVYNNRVNEEIAKSYFYSRLTIEFKGQFLVYYQSYSVFLVEIKKIADHNQRLFALLDNYDREMIIVNIPDVHSYNQLKTEEESRALFYRYLYKFYDNKFYNLVESYKSMQIVRDRLRCQNIELRFLLCKKTPSVFVINGVFNGQSVRMFCSVVGPKKSNRGRKKLPETKRERIRREKREAIQNAIYVNHLNLKKVSLVYKNNYMRSGVSLNTGQGVIIKNFPLLIRSRKVVIGKLDKPVMGDPLANKIKDNHIKFDFNNESFLIHLKKVLKKRSKLKNAKNAKNKRKGRKRNYRLFLGSKLYDYDLLMDDLDLIESDSADLDNGFVDCVNYLLGYQTKLIYNKLNFYEFFLNLPMTYSKLNLDLIYNRSSVKIVDFFYNFHILNVINSDLILYLNSKYDNTPYLLFAGYNLENLEKFLNLIGSLNLNIDLDRLCKELTCFSNNLAFNNLNLVDSLLILNLKIITLMSLATYISLYFIYFQNPVPDLNKIFYYPDMVKFQSIYLLEVHLVIANNFSVNFLTYFKIIEFSLFLKSFGFIIIANDNTQYCVLLLKDLLTKDLINELNPQYKQYSGLFFNYTLTFKNFLDSTGLILINVQSKLCMSFKEYIELEFNREYKPIEVLVDNRIQTKYEMDIVKKYLRYGRKKRIKFSRNKNRLKVKLGLPSEPELKSQIEYNLDSELDSEIEQSEISLDPEETELDNMEKYIKKINFHMPDDTKLSQMLEVCEDQNQSIVKDLIVLPKEVQGQVNFYKFEYEPFILKEGAYELESDLEDFDAEMEKYIQEKQAEEQAELAKSKKSNQESSESSDESLSDIVSVSSSSSSEDSLEDSSDDDDQSLSDTVLPSPSEDSDQSDQSDQSLSDTVSPSSEDSLEDLSDAQYDTNFYKERSDLSESYEEMSEFSNKKIDINKLKKHYTDFDNQNKKFNLLPNPVITEWDVAAYDEAGRPRFKVKRKLTLLESVFSSDEEEFHEKLSEESEIAESYKFFPVVKGLPLNEKKDEIEESEESSGLDLYTVDYSISIITMSVFEVETLLNSDWTLDSYKNKSQFKCTIQNIDLQKFIMNNKIDIFLNPGMFHQKKTIKPIKLIKIKFFDMMKDLHLNNFLKTNYQTNVYFFSSVFDCDFNFSESLPFETFIPYPNIIDMVYLYLKTPLSTLNKVFKLYICEPYNKKIEVQPVGYINDTKLRSILKNPPVVPFYSIFYCKIYDIDVYNLQGCSKTYMLNFLKTQKFYYAEKQSVDTFRSLLNIVKAFTFRKEIPYCAPNPKFLDRNLDLNIYYFCYKKFGDFECVPVSNLSSNWLLSVDKQDTIYLYVCKPRVDQYLYWCYKLIREALYKVYHSKKFPIKSYCVYIYCVDDIIMLKQKDHIMFEAFTTRSLLDRKKVTVSSAFLFKLLQYNKFQIGDCFFKKTELQLPLDKTLFFDYLFKSNNGCVIKFYSDLILDFKSHEKEICSASQMRNKTNFFAYKYVCIPNGYPGTISHFMEVDDAEDDAVVSESTALSGYKNFKYHDDQPWEYEPNYNIYSYDQIFSDVESDKF